MQLLWLAIGQCNFDVSAPEAALGNAAAHMFKRVGIICVDKFSDVAANDFFMAAAKQTARRPC